MISRVWREKRMPGACVRRVLRCRVHEFILTVAAHGDGIRHADGVELPAEHALLLDGPLDNLTKLEHCMYCTCKSVSLSHFSSCSHRLSLVTHNVCCTHHSISFQAPIDKGNVTNNVLAWIALPPNTRNADLRRRLHRLLVWHSSAVQHSLLSLSHQLPISMCSIPTCGDCEVHTCAPGKSWSFVMRRDQRFSGPPGGRHGNWR